MKNKKFNLTESQLNGIVKKVLNEIGYDDPMVHAGELHRMIEALRNVEANVEGMNEFLGGDPDDLAEPSDGTRGVASSPHTGQGG